MTVYVSIGNSDDKLTQPQWHDFVASVDSVLRSLAFHRHGMWFSASDSEYQNACWCIEIRPDRAAQAKERLADIAADYLQESIAWAEAVTEFVTPTPALEATP